MSEVKIQSRFFINMSLLLLGLVILGFGANSFALGLSPLDMPWLFHIHGVTYLLWFILLVVQTRLIANSNRLLHKMLGLSSLVIIPMMVATAFMMSGVSYDRGISPIPDMQIQQFMALPMLDIVAIILFYAIAFLNRHTPLTHKHGMIVLSVVIMDPALTRLGIVLGFPPLGLILHLMLIGMVILHDRKTYQKIHWLSWFGLVYIIARPVFLMTVAGTEGWTNLIDGLFAS